MLCWEGGGSRRVVGDFDEVFLGKKKSFSCTDICRSESFGIVFNLFLSDEFTLSDF